MRRGRINAPFCYQTLGALERLRERFAGQRRSTALAIYLALTELANEAQDPRRRGFRAERKTVAEKAGTSPSTITNYLPDLEATGLVRVEREDGEALEWELLEPDETWTPRTLRSAGGPSQPVAGSLSTAGSPPNSDQEGPSEPLAGPLTMGRNRDNTPSPEGSDPAPVGGDPGHPLEVSRKRTTVEERVLAAAILGEFNRQFETDFRHEEYLIGVIGRIRERPDMDLAGHGEVIARTKAAGWWDGPASPRLIYGNGRAFEQAINRKPGDGAEFEHSREAAGDDMSAYDRERD